MEQILRRAWGDFYEQGIMPTDTWFATLYFVFKNMTKSSAEKRIRTWLGRIEQSLKDLNYISNRPSEGLWAIVVHSPANTHAHLLVGAPGLSNLDKARWEERWKEIMVHKGKTPTCVIYTAWEGPHGAASYMADWKNLEDESEIWFRGIVPRTSGDHQA